MRHRIPLLSVVFSLLAATVHAQIAERIDVRVLNVDAVVTDRDGNRITGLSPEDFELYENGVRRPITNFHEVRASGDPSPSPSGASTTPVVHPRLFVLFVDTWSLHPGVRNSLVEASRGFLDRHLEPDDRAAIVSWNDGLRVVTPVSGDKEALKAGLDSLLQLSSPLSTGDDVSRVQQFCTRSFEMARSGRLPMPVAYEECIGYARNETSAIALRSRRLMRALDTTIAMVSGMDGRKILVLAGAQLPEQPGSEIFRWANALFATSPAMSGFRRPTATAQIDANSQVEAIDRLVRSANGSGVSLYTLHLPVFHDPNSVQGSRSGVRDFGIDFAKWQNSARTFQSLAESTGGLAVSRPGELDAALDEIARDTDSWYSLGYRPADSEPGVRAIRVRPRNPAHTVRARQSYVLKSPEELMGDRVISNLFDHAPAGDWKIELRAATPREKGRMMEVPVEVTIPSSITLLAQDSMMVGGFDVFVVVGSDEGALSEVTRHSQPISIRPGEEPGFRSEPLTFTASLTVRPGVNHLSVAVVDHVSQNTGFARITIDATKR